MKKANTAFRMHRSTYLIFKDSSTESSSTSPSVQRMCVRDALQCCRNHLNTTIRSPIPLGPVKTIFFLFCFPQTPSISGRRDSASVCAVQFFPHLCNRTTCLSFAFLSAFVFVRESRRVFSRSCPFRDFFTIKMHECKNCVLKERI